MKPFYIALFLFLIPLSPMELTKVEEPQEELLKVKIQKKGLFPSLPRHHRKEGFLKMKKHYEEILRESIKAQSQIKKGPFFYSDLYAQKLVHFDFKAYRPEIVKVELSKREIGKSCPPFLFLVLSRGCFLANKKIDLNINEYLAKETSRFRKDKEKDFLSNVWSFSSSLRKNLVSYFQWGEDFSSETDKEIARQVAFASSLILIENLFCFFRKEKRSDGLIIDIGMVDDWIKASKADILMMRPPKDFKDFFRTIQKIMNDFIEINFQIDNKKADPLIISKFTTLFQMFPFMKGHCDIWRSKFIFRVLERFFPEDELSAQTFCNGFREHYNSFKLQEDDCIKVRVSKWYLSWKNEVAAKLGVFFYEKYLKKSYDNYDSRLSQLMRGNFNY